MSTAAYFHFRHAPRFVPKPLPAGMIVDVVCPEGELIDASDLRKLEELDDVIFATLEGDAAALDKAPALWRKLQQEAPPVLLKESREQYIRRAEAVLKRYQDEPLEALGPAFAAIEILALLAD